MEHLNELERICVSYDCALEYAGDEGKTPKEYDGWENCFLIFAPDAQEDEYDLFVLRNYETPEILLEELKSQKGQTSSLKRIIADFTLLV